MGRRICMVVHHYFPRDVRVRREALALCEAGFELSVVCLRGPGQAPTERWRGIDIFRQPVQRHRGSPLPVYMLEYLHHTARSGLAVARAQRARAFDAVHVHTPPDFLLAAALPARLGGARLVLDIHDLSPELYGTRFPGAGERPAKALLGLVEQAACRLADRVVTVTDVFARRLHGRGLDPGKTLVLHNCPDEDLFTPSRRATKRAPGRFQIIHHGTLMRRYGVDVLIDAFALLGERLPTAHLDVYGEGDLQSELARKVEVAGLGDRIRLHGDVPQETLGAALEQADLCVVPNRSDPFTDLLLPTKLLEAMRMGCPVLTSRTPTVAELFGDGQVELVPAGSAQALAEAILALAAEPGRRAELARRGREAVARFSWRNEKAKLVAMYEGLL